MLKTFAGAAIGLFCHLLWPIALVLITILAPFMRRVDYWPRFLITPDDPFVFGNANHFGEYEPTVKRIYQKFGRIIGDIYWLGWRNKLYGLRLMFKPKILTLEWPIVNYMHLVPTMRRVDRGRLRYYEVAGYGMLEILLTRKFKLIAGWKVDGIVRDPAYSRRIINAEGRPVLSLRYV